MVLVFAGKLDPVKGVDVLILLWRSIARLWQC